MTTLVSYQIALETGAQQELLKRRAKTTEDRPATMAGDLFFISTILNLIEVIIDMEADIERLEASQPELP